MRRLLRDNGLSLVLLALFAGSMIGQSTSGWGVFNQDQADHGQAEIGYLAYLRTAHFVEAVFENWESEFLQMAVYVLLTAFLIQRGSAESKDPDQPDPPEADPDRARHDPNAPWPVRRGGVALTVYRHSLSLALALLFALSFWFHAAGGAREYSQEQMTHGGQPVSTGAYLGTAQFWFESFQNWQSEFLSIGALVVLSIFLRQQGSPESKPLGAPHAKTGAE